MRLFNTLGITCLSALFILQGCKRDEVINTKSLADFFQENGVPDQFFTINTDTVSYFVTTNYTGVLVDSGAFVNSSNEIVIGPVTIRLKEMITKKDMILSGIFPVAGGQPLVSGGEFYIEAIKNGEKLRLARPNAITLGIPCKDTIRKTNYRGFYETNLTAETDWGTPSDTIVPFSNGMAGPGSVSGFYYDFTVDSLAWINCDHFYSAGGVMTDIKANVIGSQYIESNTKVFLAFTDENSASYMSKESGLYVPSGGYQLPLGLNITFVAISIVNGQYYSAFQSTSVTPGHIENLNLSPTTLDDFKTQLENL
jgi:hypothetical protein